MNIKRSLFRCDILKFLLPLYLRWFFFLALWIKKNNIILRRFRLNIVYFIFLNIYYKIYFTLIHFLSQITYIHIINNIYIQINRVKNIFSYLRPLFRNKVVTFYIALMITFNVHVLYKFIKRELTIRVYTHIS